MDLVNHPDHYTQGKIECIEAIEAATTELTGIEAVCTGNAIKYLWRWKSKNGLEDLKKARWYLDHLIQEVEDKSVDEQAYYQTLSEVPDEELAYYSSRFKD